MHECTLTQERMPMLLTESLGGAEREDAHLHIESCEVCGRHWSGLRQTWVLLGQDQDRAVPDGLKRRFLDEIGGSAPAVSEDNVVSFWRRPATRWVAQAAAVATLVGGAYFAGNQTGETRTVEPMATQVSLVPSPFSLAASQTINASDLAPIIDGAPSISNVRFIEDPGRDGEVGVSFDLTSNVTVTGSRDEKSFVSLMAYLLQDRSNPSPSRSDAIQWVGQTYGEVQNADPAIVDALANVLGGDAHEGVRLRAIEALRLVQTQSPADESSKARDALIVALKNDPNPAIRIKAVEALTAMLSGDGSFDPLTIETLREKASQSDENPYVRFKAAEALSQLNL